MHMKCKFLILSLLLALPTIVMSQGHVQRLPYVLTDSLQGAWYFGDGSPMSLHSDAVLHGLGDRIVTPWFRCPRLGAGVSASFRRTLEGDDTCLMSYAIRVRCGDGRAVMLAALPAVMHHETMTAGLDRFGGQDVQFEIICTGGQSGQGLWLEQFELTSKGPGRRPARQHDASLAEMPVIEVEGLVVKVFWGGNMPMEVYDSMGSLVASDVDVSQVSFTMPSAGVYFVKVAGWPVQKVTVGDDRREPTLLTD